MAFASPEDVAIELGRPTSSITDAEREQWTAWLERVERSIRRRFRREGLDLDNQINIGDPSIEEVVDVEVAVVSRRVRNPEGLTSTTVTIDDGTITRRREGADDALGLDLTDIEWEALLPRSEPQAFTVRATFEPDRRHCEW